MLFTMHAAVVDCSDRPVPLINLSSIVVPAELWACADR